MASMRNGQGDAWFCVFSNEGAFLKGFDHESPMSPWNLEPSQVWRGVLDGVPESFKPFATEPAFSMADTTFCIWCGHQDDAWHTGHIQYPEGDDPDGSKWMLSILDGDPENYKSWAESYYERSLNLDLPGQPKETQSLPSAHPRWPAIPRERVRYKPAEPRLPRAVQGHDGRLHRAMRRGAPQESRLHGERVPRSAPSAPESPVTYSFFISRCSHASAILRSRRAVTAEMFNASATSSIESPPK
jgi:hypothetical protein